MHEMSIVQGIIDLCLEHTDGRRVTSIDVEIGELSSVVPEAVDFCFEACSRDTTLDGAKLNIIRIEGKAVCQECGTMFQLAELYGACTKCQSCRITVISGEELRVREIEVED